MVTFLQILLYCLLALVAICFVLLLAFCTFVLTEAIIKQIRKMLKEWYGDD